MADWDVNDVAIESRELTSLCEPDPLLRKLIMTHKVSYNLLQKTCSNLGGRMPVAFDKEKLAQTSAQFLVSVLCCNIFKTFS